jgi:hypothetical protein
MRKILFSFFISVLSFLLRPRNLRSRSENSSPRHHKNKHFRQPDLHKNVLPYSHRRHCSHDTQLIKTDGWNNRFLTQSIHWEKHQGPNSHWAYGGKIWLWEHVVSGMGLIVHHEMSILLLSKSMHSQTWIQYFIRIIPTADRYEKIHMCPTNSRDLPHPTPFL